MLYTESMSMLRAQVHAKIRDLQEDLYRAYWTARIIRARRQVDQEIAVAQRQLARSSGALSGMARRLANLTYPIDQARQLALAKFDEHKQAAMAAMLEALQEQAYSVRQLADLLSISKSSASNYRRELIGAGLLAA